MARKPINEKPKDKKGCGCLLIILIILGFVVSVYLFGQGALSDIIHP